MNFARMNLSFRWKGTVQSKMVLQEIPLFAMEVEYSGQEEGSS